MKNSSFKLFGWIVLSLSVICFSACGPSSGDSPSALRFAVIADTHLDALQPLNARAHRKLAPKDIREKFSRLLEAINKENVDFVVITGDVVNFASRANVLLLKEEITRSGLKVFWVPGNHDREMPKPSRDMLDETQLESEAPAKKKDWKAVWRDAGVNPKSSKFMQKGYCFIFLDDSNGRFDKAAIGRASAFLDKNPDCRAFVFFHKPLKMPQESRQAAKRYGKAYGPPFVSGKYDVFPPSPIFPFIKRYQERIEAIFAGHIHSSARDTWKNRFDQFVLESGTEKGAYALVECKGSEGCDTSILKAWPPPSPLGSEA